MRGLRLCSLALAIGATVGGPTAAQAMEKLPYTNANFEQAVASNAPLIIGVWADWCGICQTQIGVLTELLEDPRFADVVVIEISFDTQRHIMLRFNVSFRSTVIAYRDGHELRRLDAETDPAQIEALLVDLVGQPRPGA